MMSIGRIIPLDGVRGVAAIMVMLFHFDYTDFYNGLVIERFKVLGQTGVDLFFVLSGFLITRILLSAKGRPNYFISFYVRRSLRIFPLYYSFLVLTYFLLPWIFDMPFTPFYQQIWYWVYLQNFPQTFGGFEFSGPGHFWSLAVEEHFYLVWPALVYFLGNRTLLPMIVGLILLPIAVRAVMIHDNIGVFYFTLTRFDALAWGALLAYIEQQGGIERARPIFLLIFIALLFTFAGLWLFESGKSVFWIQVAKYTVIAIIYFSLLGLVVGMTKGNPVFRLLSMPPIRFAGLISYGLYVYHPIVYSFVQKAQFQPSLRFVISVTLVFIIASLSYFFFESKVLALKSRFS